MKVYRLNYWYIGLHTIVELYNVLSKFLSYENRLSGLVLRFIRSEQVSRSVRNIERAIRQAITMNALAEIFYIASGAGDAATPSIAVPTDVYITRVDTTHTCIFKICKKRLYVLWLKPFLSKRIVFKQVHILSYLG